MSEIVDNQEGQTYVRGRTLGDSKTNTDPDSCVQCEISCEDQWSLVQMEAIACMSEGNELLTSALRRAKRTAGNYAALYLADEGTPQAGRFYWPGLAAFAAKQVVDGIEYADENLDSWLGQKRTLAAVSLYYLLKGNLWVFFEIAPWMMFYRKHGKELFNHCMDRRNVNTYDTPVRDLVQKLPWATGKNIALEQSLRQRIRVTVWDTDEMRVTPFRIDDAAGALAEVANCQATDPLKAGFAKLQESEALAVGSRKRASAARDSAAKFLDHEQKLHLQKMVYDHRYFRTAMDYNDMGRSVDGWSPWDFTGARHPEMVFNAAARITPKIIESDLTPHGLSEQGVVVRMALKDGKLYDVSDRMRYVNRILDQYHRLMRKKTSYMIRQLRLIEGLKNA